MAITISIAEALPPVAEFYKTAGYGGGVSPADLTLCAYIDERLIGVVRLCPEQGTTVLRGMQVHPEFQRQGVGALLLADCVPHLEQGSAYCLPYDHLIDFYRKAGFELAGHEQLPPFLAERQAGYLASGQKVVAMRRLKSGAAPR